MSRDKLWHLTTSARWFGGRGRDARLADVTALPSSGPVVSHLLDVAYADGAVERYHVPLVKSALPGVAEAVDEGLHLWQAFATGAPGFQLFDDLPRPGAARRFTGEQSNTSVFFDNGTMLKVLRRVEPGADIEAELLEALRGSGVAPELHGVWSHGDLPLGVLVESLPDPDDGFDLATASAAAGRSFEEHAAALGGALATVHAQLRSALPTRRLDVRAFARGALERFEEAASSVPELERFRAEVTRRFGELPTVELVAQRVHGDCHLGQTLLSEGRWRYVDFEGEPIKSVAERRALDSGLRDVAGMLRSFDYAAATAGAAPAWLAAARDAFTRGYGPTESQDLLQLYELDKAIYEAVYEARFRPSKLVIPLTGIAALLGEG